MLFSDLKLNDTDRQTEGWNLGWNRTEIRRSRGAFVGKRHKVSADVFEQIQKEHNTGISTDITQPC